MGWYRECECVGYESGLVFTFFFVFGCFFLSLGFPLSGSLHIPAYIACSLQFAFMDRSVYV